MDDSRNGHGFRDSIMLETQRDAEAADDRGGLIRNSRANDLEIRSEAKPRGERGIIEYLKTVFIAQGDGDRLGDGDLRRV